MNPSYKENRMQKQIKREDERQPLFQTAALNCILDELEQGSPSAGDDEETEDEPDQRPICEGCADRPAVAEVDDSDPSVGYYSTLYLCEECAMGGRR